MRSSYDRELLERQNEILARLQRITEMYPKLAGSTGISLRDVATLVGRSYRTVQRWADEGTIPIRYAGGRWPVVTLADLPRVMEEHRKEPR